MNWACFGCHELRSNGPIFNSYYTELLSIMKKKYAEILFHYRWLFFKGNVIIGEWGIFGVEIFLVIADFLLKVTSL